MRKLLVASVAVFALGSVVLADDVKKDTEAPPAVVAAVQKKYPGANLGKFDREKVGGNVCWEVDVKITPADAKADVKVADTKVAARKIEVLVSNDGKILSEKEKIATADLPSAVRKGLDASKYAKWNLKSATRVVKEEKTADTRFVLKVQEKDSVVSVTLDNDGKVVAEKVKNKKKKGDDDDGDDDDDDDDDGDDD